MSVIYSWCYLYSIKGLKWKKVWQGNYDHFATEYSESSENTKIMAQYVKNA